MRTKKRIFFHEEAKTDKKRKKTNEKRTLCKFASRRVSIKFLIIARANSLDLAVILQRRTAFLLLVVFFERQIDE